MISPARSSTDEGAPITLRWEMPAKNRIDTVGQVNICILDLTCRLSRYEEDSYPPTTTNDTSV